MDIGTILAQLIGGAVGGTAGGKVIKESDLGSLGNLIVGAIGGVGGGSLLGSILGAAAGDASAGLDRRGPRSTRRRRRGWSNRSNCCRPDQEQADQQSLRLSH